MIAVIWNNYTTLPEFFLVSDDSFKRFHVIEVNTYYEDERKAKLENELAEACYNSEGVFLFKTIPVSEFQEAVREGADIVCVGEIP